MADTTRSTKAINVGLWLAGFAVLIIVEIGVIIYTFPIPGSPKITSAALFALLTGSALGIERTIELGWTLVGLTAGAWWPITNVNKGVNDLVAAFKSDLEPFYEQAQTLITQLQAGNAAAQQKAAQAATVLASIRSDLNNIKATSLPEFQVYVNATSARVDQLRVLLNEAGELSPLADQALDIVSSLVGSFKDNPGRRFLSLFVGIVLGLAVSAIIGLDIFQVPAETAINTGTNTVPYFPQPFGVIVSGFVIGLGSSPTHEIIKLVQETKRRFKGNNNSASAS